jgi:hypothetical protein
MTMTTTLAPRKRKLLMSKYLKRPEQRGLHRDEIMQLIYSRAGYAAAVAKHLDVSPQTISAWRRVPAHHVLDLAPLLEMTPEQIRPDVFGKRRP